jgi:hypothetical protein
MEKIINSQFFVRHISKKLKGNRKSIILMTTDIKTMTNQKSPAIEDIK